MAIKLTKAEKRKQKALLGDAKKLRERDKAKAAERGKKLTLSKDFKPTVPARTPPKDTSKRPSSRAFANNRNVIESLVEPEKVPVNNPSTMSGSRDSQRQAFSENKTGVSKNYKVVNGKMVEIDEAEWKKAAQKFVKQEGTGKGTIKKGQTVANAPKQSRADVLRGVVAKVQGKRGLGGDLSAAERKMAREGNAPARAPATPPSVKPVTPAAAEAPKAPVASTAPKMTRAERSAANKAKHAEVRAAEEKKWAEQKAAKKGGAPKPAGKAKAPTKAAAPAAKKTIAAKPATKAATKAAPAPKKAAKTKAAAPAKAAPTSAPTPAAPASPAPKAGIGSKLKAYGKSLLSPKAIVSEIGGSFAADAIRGDGKSTARNIAATVVDDATTGFAVGKGYGAVAGAAVGLVRGAQAEGKRTGKAPLALPSSPKQGGTFGAKKPAAGGSKGPTSRGGVRGAKAATPAPASAPASEKPKAAPLAKKKAAPVKTAAPVASKAPAAAPMTANPDKAIADFEAKLRGAGVISIAGGAGGKAQMVQQPMSVTQLEDQFKRKKGPR